MKNGYSTPVRGPGEILRDRRAAGADLVLRGDPAMAHSLSGSAVAVDETLPRRREIDHLGDVGGMVADALDILGDEQQMGRAGDVLRIFHHEGEKGAEDAVVEIVDGAVPLAYRSGLGGVALDEGVEDVVNHPGGDSRHLAQQRHR